MKVTFHQRPGDIRPKRGDLIQTNLGTVRERTWFVLSARSMPIRWCAVMGIDAQRTKIWAERWWEIEPETRIALFKSAERAGGQRTYLFQRFPQKSKPKARIYD